MTDDLRKAVDLFGGLEVSGTLPDAVARHVPSANRSDESDFPGASKAGATGLEPATSGVTGRDSRKRPQSVVTRIDWFSQSLYRAFLAFGPSHLLRRKIAARNVVAF
jgi:hypothetical protein